ncbi:MAG: hypothetical protein ACJ763_08640 [Bdellovibrionia bacterium]
MNGLTRAKTSSAAKSAAKSVSKTLGLLLPTVLATLLLSGCFENIKGIVLMPRTSTSTATTTSSYAFTISKVLLNSSNPSGIFDVKGDGSYSFAKYCRPASSTDTSGATTCNCVYDFNYTDPTTGAVNSQQITADTVYAEADLVRCPYGTVPPSVSAVSVSLATKDGVSKSNSVSFDFGTSNSVLDTSKDFNFARVIRYTCRQKIYAKNALDPQSGIYDPFQSEGDPGSSYPTSFYTTNMGASLMAFASKIGDSVVSDYECPADPRPPDSVYSETIYSTAPLPNGKYVISGDPGANPVNMNRDNPRSTFYLSKLKTGIFTINVNAYIAPYRVSVASTTINPSGGGIPSLGWGASPRATGVGTETCPADTPTNGSGVANPDYVKIPTGYHWVKVWLFRMALPARQYLYGANLQRMGAIGCSPGLWSPLPYPAAPTNIYNSQFPDCYGQTALGAGPNAARFAQNFGICFQAGTWNPAGNDQSYSCGKPSQVPFANLASSTAGGVGVCNAGNPTNTTPIDEAPVVTYIDNPSSLRYEFLFVVTPPSVNSGDMSNSSSPIYAQYAPLRFRVDSDCNSVNPSGCSAQHMFRNYGLKLHDVTNAGDPPADDPSRAGSFPICALQPDSALGQDL